MKTVKRFLTLFIVMSLTFAFPIHAKSESIKIEREKITFEASEYDAIIQGRTELSKQLLERGYSQKDIEAMIDRTPERELLQRSQLTSNELATLYHYTSDQIETLKKYDGSPLEKNPQLRKIMASLSGAVYCMYASSSKIIARFNWQWSSTPQLSAYTDVVAMTWEGNNSQGYNIVTQFKSNDSDATVAYYYTGSGVYCNSDHPSFNVLNANHHAVVPVLRLKSPGPVLAESGSVTLAVGPNTSNNLSNVTFGFSFGMVTSSAQFSVSFPAGLSISFSGNTIQMKNIQVDITSTGQLTLISQS
ncbi:MAG: hypothetical protein E7423_02530 [Ruminococcaceae bacterium]|jgi:DNA-binding MarR family transcriptional regulator|nr:hypothetical protein [Oscillospiraceae bacterium]